jgi:hypothetical protein
MGAGGPWTAVEAIADNAHGFNAKEITAKIRFHKKNGSDMVMYALVGERIRGWNVS